MKQTSEEQDKTSLHRHRLLEGMARAVAAKGYPDTTIADIVREAAVSRRTFYEHFSTKADCLIALYEAASRGALDVLRAAIDPVHDWEGQAEAALAAYFDCLSQNPALMRTLFVEILGLGADGLAARRRVNQELAAFMLEVVNGAARRRRRPVLSADLAMAVVGGINELVLQAIEEGRVGGLRELTGVSVGLLRAVTRGE
ncbi:MAG TPA: TetR/AcrR family transcriptional regulator [Noviherbaspirillum sp.]|jgi:AcrR family transcriptional regulator|uniref:TetR/AcrR family transcriptional regulator n=1 Tax=Noviherbaspirillum sp. TaxID=1926288 RepID=UPI002F959AC5